MILVLVLAGLSLSSGLLTYLLGKEIHDALQSRHWPQQLAIIRKSLIEVGRTRYGPVYTVHVEFEYDAVGRESGICTLPSRWGTRREDYAERIAEHFHAGATVPIHIHPRDPQKTYLMVGVEMRDWAFAGLFGTTAVLSLVGAILMG